MSLRTVSIGESSSSSSLSSQQDVGDDRMIAEILSEENTKSNGAVGRRLSHLDSIPHVPRINGSIPDEDDATFDHHRLIERLHTYGLSELKVSGDGNCQFRALSDQLYNSPDHHKHVRKEVVKQLKKYRSAYEGYVPMKYKRYYRKMRKSGEWGDHVTLQRLLIGLKLKYVCLLHLETPASLRLFQDKSLQKEVMFLEGYRNHYFVHCSGPIYELWLSFWSEVHYNSLYEVGEVPFRQPKKKHWLF